MTVKFNELVNNIIDINQTLAAQAARAVNVSLTLRNWMIGYHIHVFELEGADRAEYGDKILASLSDKLLEENVSNCDKSRLYRYLRFYRTYPAIVATLSPQLQNLLPPNTSVEKVATLLPQFENRKVATLSPQLQTPLDKLFAQLSYSHLELLVDIDDDLKRQFYEIECIQGNWSVRELRHQINSLYYERCGLSRNKQKLAELNNKSTERELAIRDPYIFEFLGLKPQEVMSESHLEDQLMDKIEKFLLELGHGFCFEARQKRILIGDEHFFVDLVFYHRILKCHVLVELKLAEFSHENIGQLNTYVSWFKHNVMTEGDNPPIGILLCTHKNKSLVEFALAGMDNQLFVSKYQLELPKAEEIKKFLMEQLRNGEL